METGQGRAALQVAGRTLAPMLVLSALTSTAYAQTPQPVATGDDDVAQAGDEGLVLPTITVSGDAAPSNSLQAGTGLSRLPGDIRDVPQTVNVISQETIEQQGATTLEQVLQNVPGITVGIGEGNGGMNGDQFRIRGFQAKGDIYADGLRDFGVYMRDSFAFENVDVIKGPSSESFGMGTAGGAINNALKNARLGDHYSIEGTLGTGPLARGVIDLNKQIGETTAVRAVGMIHNQDLVDRDHVFSDRWGFLGSFATGLGTNLTWTLNYLHQEGNRKPDMGVPIIDPDTDLGPVIGRPVTEYGVPRSNFYGKQSDADKPVVDMFTSRLTYEPTDWLTLSNDTRLAFNKRYWAQTVVTCTGACLTSVLDGSFNAPYGFGGPAGFVQDNWGIQNISTAVAKFDTGPLRHELVAGIDIFRQEDDRIQLANSVDNTLKNAGTIGIPDYSSNYTVSRNLDSLKKATADNIALFASDRVWFTEQLSVLGGLRWDSYRARYDYTTAGVWNPAIKADNSFVSPKASVIWEPAPNQTYYVSWAKSFAPVGQFITNDNNSINITPGASDMTPEESVLWELGAKLNLLDDRLGLTAALFRVTKSNAKYVDPLTGDTVLGGGDAGETRRVQGLELGLTGKITDAWTIQAAYAYMDSEVRSSDTLTNIGNRVGFVPEHAASLWTTYNIAAHMPSLDGELLIGAGVVYQDSYFVNSANSSEIPATFSLNGLISYENDNFKVAVNGYNLTDELNYDAGFSSRAVVGAGRTVTLSAGVKF